MNTTPIEYLDFTWNPLAMRCTPVSEGCAHCWHLAMAHRLAGNPALSNEVRAAYAGDRPPLLVGSRLHEPLKHKEPARIGVQFMGDLFHDDVSFDFIGKVFATIIAADWHTLQILTKRPARMEHFISWFLANTTLNLRSFRHIWLGVTVENQDTIWRIDKLMQIPAALRFVSFEPLLDDVTAGLEQSKRSESIDWAIVGGESGPGARPMHPDWPRALREWAQAAGVPFFFKQWGSWVPGAKDRTGKLRNHGYFCADGKWINRSQLTDTAVRMSRVSKKAAGRLLDGREWNETPPELTL